MDLGEGGGGGDVDDTDDRGGDVAEGEVQPGRAHVSEGRTGRPRPSGVRCPVSGVLVAYDGRRHGAHVKGRSRRVEDAVSR